MQMGEKAFKMVTAAILNSLRVLFDSGHLTYFQ